jgi:hypothetical protein
MEVGRDRLRDQDIRAGQDRTRGEAIGNAEKAIERALQRQRFKQELNGEDQ